LVLVVLVQHQAAAQTELEVIVVQTLPLLEGHLPRLLLRALFLQAVEGAALDHQMQLKKLVETEGLVGAAELQAELLEPEIPQLLLQAKEITEVLAPAQMILVVAVVLLEREVG
jgi:hypothetical protein